MKIWIHRYELKPLEKKNKPRQGALIKTEWATHQVGYSDLHPWPEFGELPLDDHLKSLRDLKFTALVDNSMEFNYWDREYRLLKRNAFLGLSLPRSHRLVFDLEDLSEDHLREWHREGFTHIKVKFGRNLQAETAALVHMAYATPMMWRVDFNGRIPEADFIKWWTSLDDSVKAKIDFVEDPVDSGDLKVKGPWANDWREQSRAQIRIVKPAREKDEELARFARIVFTHSLDHTFGQACAAWVAAKFYTQHPKKLEVCGLANSGFFEPNEFSQSWNCSGPRMKPTEGTGFGFDKLLADTKWERLL